MPERSDEAGVLYGRGGERSLSCRLSVSDAISENAAARAFLDSVTRICFGSCRWFNSLGHGRKQHRTAGHLRQPDDNRNRGLRSRSLSASCVSEVAARSGQRKPIAFYITEQDLLSVSHRRLVFYEYCEEAPEFVKDCFQRSGSVCGAFWQDKNVEHKPDGRRRGQPRSSKDCSWGGQMSFSGRKDMCENVKEAKWNLLSSAVDAAVIEPAASARTLNEWSCPVKAFRESSSYLRGRGYLGRNQRLLRSTPSKVSAACS